MSCLDVNPFFPSFLEARFVFPGFLWCVGTMPPMTWEIFMATTLGKYVLRPKNADILSRHRLKLNPPTPTPTAPDWEPNRHFWTLLAKVETLAQGLFQHLPLILLHLCTKQFLGSPFCQILMMSCLVEVYFVGYTGFYVE